MPVFRVEIAAENEKEVLPGFQWCFFWHAWEPVLVIENTRKTLKLIYLQDRKVEHWKERQ